MRHAILLPILLCAGAITMAGCMLHRSPDYHMRIAGRLYQQGAYEQAIEECNKALVADPFHKQAYYNIGSSYAKMGRWEKAKEAFTKAIWMKETYPEPHYGLAVAYFETGDYVHARQEIARYLELVPGDQRAQKLQKHLEEKP